MPSPIDYFFMKSLDKCVVIIINILSFGQDINWFHDEKYHPCPRWFVLTSTTRLPSTNLFVFCVIPWDPCYPAFVLLYLGVLPSFMSRMSWGLLHLLRILGISDTYHHHHSFSVPVLILTRIPTFELWCVNSKLLATLLLWSNGRVSFKFFCSSNHHSNIGRATQPVLRAHPSTNV